jgi:hypothetical protein
MKGNQNMTEQQFQSEMTRAKTMQRIDPERSEYWMGYQRGLRRAYHGDSFGTEDEHALWMSLAAEDDEGLRQRGLGYRQALGIG